MNNENWNNIFALYFGIIQILDFELNVRQISNDTIFSELQKQNEVLDEQTNTYLKKIVEQNELIIKQNNDILEKIK